MIQFVIDIYEEIGNYDKGLWYYMDLITFQKITTLFFSYLKNVLNFCTNNIYSSMVIVGISVPIFIFFLYRLKNFFWPESSIIHKARFKSTADKKLISFKKIHTGKVFRTHSSSSEKKKYILVPFEEWEEFIKHKEEEQKRQNPSSTL